MASDTSEAGVVSQLVDRFQTGQEPPFAIEGTVQEAVVKGHAKAAAERSNKLQVHEFLEVNPQPRIAPVDGLAQFPAAESLLIVSVGGGLLVHEFLDEGEQVASRTREISQGVAKRLVGDLVGNGNIIQGDLQIIAQFEVVSQRSLQLVQEGDRQDQLEILGLIPPNQQMFLGIGEEWLERVDHGHQPQEPLEGMVAMDDPCARLALAQAIQGMLLSLALQDGARLRRRLVHAYQDEPTPRFGICVRVGGGLEDRGRAVNRAGLGFEFACERVLDGRLDHQLPGRDEVADSVIRSFCPGHLLQGQHLVAERVLAPVEEGLVCQRGQSD